MMPSQTMNLTLEQIEAIEQLKNISLDQIASVYSGKPGCCCGCRGKHYSDPSTNAAMFRKVFYLLKANEEKVSVEGGYVAAQINGREYIAYLKETGAQIAAA